MKRPNVTTTTAALTAAGLLGAGLYVAVPAVAAPERPAAATPDESGKPGKPGRHGKKWQRALRGVHGEATVRTGKADAGFAKISWQRGEITAISGPTLSVRSADGTSWQWTTNAATRVRKDRAKVTVAKLAVKDKVLIVGPLDGPVRTAKRVIAP